MIPQCASRRLRTHGRGWPILVGLACAALVAPGGPHAFCANRAPLLTSARLGDASSDPDAVAYQLVFSMLDAQRTLVFTGEQVTTVYGASGPVSSSQQTVTHDGLKGLRIDFHSPARLAGESRGDNGRILWHFVVRKHSVEQLPSALERLDAESRRAATRLKKRAIVCRLVGEDVIAGRRTQVVLITPAALAGAIGPGSRRVWIDPVNGAQLRIIVYGPAGAPLSDSYFTSIAYNPSVNPSLFDPPLDATRTAEIPAEVPVSSLRHIPPGFVPSLKFDPLEPDYLPAGYRFDNGQVFSYKGSPALGIRYVNGVTVISLYETNPAKTNLHDHFRIPRSGMLTGYKGGIQIVLIANLDTVELTRIYQSLR